MSNKIIKYSEPVPFHKAMPGAESVVIWKRDGGFTPAVARTAKPKNPTRAKARLAGNVAIDDEDGFIPEAKKGTTMVDYDISRGPYHAILDKMARARQGITW